MCTFREKRHKIRLNDSTNVSCELLRNSDVHVKLGRRKILTPLLFYNIRNRKKLQGNVKSINLTFMLTFRQLVNKQ